MNAKLIRSLALWVFLLCWVAMTAALWICGQHLLAYCTGIPLVLVAIGEIVSTIRTGESMSQRFLRTLTHPQFCLAVTIAVMGIVGWSFLWVHLLWR